MKTLDSEKELFELYKKHFESIKKFFEISTPYENSEDLCKRAITGSTFRSFVRRDKSNSGMSSIFKSVTAEHFKNNPTKEITKKLFFEDITAQSRDKFKNWEMDPNGKPKILKVYNLYANYWVAYQLHGSLGQKLESIENLKLPLDKYSLNFVRTLYNNFEKKPYFKLKSTLSMGSVKSLDHYKSINLFISRLANGVPKYKGIPFQPIFIDIIQAEENNLNWYELNFKNQ
jgi:hypothetical protein